MDAQTPANVAAHPTTGALRTPLALLGDERLARLCEGGSEGAFAAVYRRHHQPLYRYCRSLLHHDADAEEALQSVFAKAYAALSSGRRSAPLRPWLYRIAHNESVTLLRRRRHHAELSSVTESLEDPVVRRAGERARLSQLLGDLAQLPERQRGALVMRELGGLNYEEIALALAMSAGAAKQAVFEARGSLLAFAEGRAMSCEEIRRAISDADGRALRARRFRAHLRDCAACATFAEAITTRRADLRAIAPPLPAAAGAAVLARALGSAHHTGVGLAGGPATATGAALAAKGAVGTALIVSAAVAASSALHRGPAAGTPAHAGAGAAHARAAGVSPLAGTPAAGARRGALRAVHTGSAAHARSDRGQGAGAGADRAGGAGVPGQLATHGSAGQAGEHGLHRGLTRHGVHSAPAHTHTHTHTHTRHSATHHASLPKAPRPAHQEAGHPASGKTDGGSATTTSSSISPAPQVQTTQAPRPAAGGHAST